MSPSGIKFPLMTFGLAGTVCIIVGYKWFLDPILRGQRQQKQEVLADMIYEFKHSKNQAEPPTPQHNPPVSQ
ncbi:hypothetical protein Pcinc_016341 [Petrolisthes cinctipes]|uniref:Transmembrane protein n=1 Tax=Petrolisthes cinctipes TaxID=88211 RepID=A0AAE1FRA8_PETCI|nr:hypothetical protein Pcinc_016341 [Petrolisthes cinctipes]